MRTPSRHPTATEVLAEAALRERREYDAAVDRLLAVQHWQQEEREGRAIPAPEMFAVSEQ